MAELTIAKTPSAKRWDCNGEVMLGLSLVFFAACSGISVRVFNWFAY